MKALHEEAMERAQGHTRRALLADPGGDQHLACLFGGRAGAAGRGLLHPACYKSIPACDNSALLGETMAHAVCDLILSLQVALVLVLLLLLRLLFPLLFLSLFFLFFIC